MKNYSGGWWLKSNSIIGCVDNEFDAIDEAGETSEKREWLLRLK